MISFRLVVTGVTLGAFLGAMTGCSSFGKSKESSLRFHEEINPQLGENRVRMVVLPFSNQTVPVSAFASLTERDIESIHVIKTAEGLSLALKFDPHGIIVMDDISVRMRGKMVVVFVDGRPVYAWQVGKRIPDGKVVITPHMTDAEIIKLSESLQRTALRHHSLYYRE
jgi:hypothetical protein